MRTILAGLCVVCAGCSGQAMNSPTSPTAATTVSVVDSRPAQSLPFRGSLTAHETDVVTFPILAADGSARGTATHLGAYTAKFNATVNVLDGSATGGYTFRAANGDELFSTFTGQAEPGGTNVASITETLTITGGTGRFAGATGTLVVRRTLDQTTGESTGSIDGSMTLQH